MSEIYRSTVLGDETTPPVKVKKLPAEEQQVYDRIQELVKAIKAGDEAIAEMRRVRSKCKHHYFDDTAGFPYDIRHCVICGAHMGQL